MSIPALSVLSAWISAKWFAFWRQRERSIRGIRVDSAVLQDGSEIHIKCSPAPPPPLILSLLHHALEAMRRWRLRSLVHGFLLETRSYYLRIVWRLRIRPDIFPGRGLPALQKLPDGYWTENIRTRACMMDIESLLAGLPWATILDCRAMVDAWNSGAEWALCNSDSDTQDRHTKARDTSAS